MLQKLRKLENSIWWKIPRVLYGKIHGNPTFQMISKTKLNDFAEQDLKADPGNNYKSISTYEDSNHSIKL